MGEQNFELFQFLHLCESSGQSVDIFPVPVFANTHRNNDHHNVLLHDFVNDAIPTAGPNTVETPQWSNQRLSLLFGVMCEFLNSISDGAFRRRSCMASSIERADSVMRIL